MILLFSFACINVTTSQNLSLYFDNDKYSCKNYVDIGNISITGNKLTVEAIIKQVNNDSTCTVTPYHDVVSKHYDNRDVNYLLRPEYAAINTTHGFFMTKPISITDSMCHHIAMVYDGSYLRFYLDDLVDSVAATGNLIINQYNTLIGYSAGFNPNWYTQFYGFIDEVRIWNIARSKEQIQEFAFTTLQHPLNQIGLMAYYNFEKSYQNIQGNEGFNGIPTNNSIIVPDSINCLIQFAVYDVDGNGYDTVRIGNQTWLKQNLYVTKYNDGSAIANITDGIAWANLETPAFSWYNNDINYGKAYGAYYNWFVVDSLSNGGKNVCPKGWKIPALSDWHELAGYLGGRDVAGGKMKVADSMYWNAPNEGATNESGFSAIGSGSRLSSLHGFFAELNGFTNFWSKEEASTTNAYQQYIMNYLPWLKWSNDTKKNGNSCRCIKDDSNHPPVANAGQNQSVDEGSIVFLNGSASSDPDGDTLTYKWTAPDGIELSSVTTAQPVFTAPDVSSDTDYVFSLIVNDGTTNSKPDYVAVTVKNTDPCPQHFHTVWEGTLGQDQMNINIIEAKLDGIDVVPGDEIGVFDGDLCVGYGKVKQTIDKQNILKITTSHDDGTENGFMAGNEITYIYWDCSDGAEYPVQTVQCFNNNLIPLNCSPFIISGTSFVKLSATSEICQTLRFKAGWNIFSVANQPNPANMTTVFQPLIENSSLLKIQDEGGNSLEDWGIFGGWTNDIGDISPTEGYKIKTSISDTVEICGAPVKYPYAIPLNSGWNIMGYSQTDAFNGMSSVVQQLIDRGTLIKVQDESGNSIEDWGIFGGWTNGIGDFSPGKGYKIKVNAKDTLWIYDNYPKLTTIQPKLVATTNFIPAYKGNGTDHMNINLVRLPINILKAGDELAIFDGTTCVGAVTILPQNMQNQTVSIVASATDNQGMAGFAESNPFTLKLWNSRNNQEYVLEPEIIKGTSTFTKHETTVASLEKYASTGLAGLPGSNLTEINCYPNPFKDGVNIEINLKADARVQIEILNQLGQQVKTITTKKQLPCGVHRLIWDAKNAENQYVSPGIYHVRIEIDDSIIHKKIVFSK